MPPGLLCCRLAQEAGHGKHIAEILFRTPLMPVKMLARMYAHNSEKMGFVVLYSKRAFLYGRCLGCFTLRCQSKAVVQHLRQNGAGGEGEV